jgi:hypothetical protein
MNEVKYYHVNETGLAEGVALGRITVVLGADFDELQQRHSEQRGLLHRALNVIRGMRYDELEAAICETLNLKPTESGASDRSHEIPGTSGQRLNQLANEGE